MAQLMNSRQREFCGKLADLLEEYEAGFWAAHAEDEGFWIGDSEFDGALPDVGELRHYAKFGISKWEQQKQESPPKPLTGLRLQAYNAAVAWQEARANELLRAHKHGE